MRTPSSGHYLHRRLESMSAGYEPSSDGIHKFRARITRRRRRLIWSGACVAALASSAVGCSSALGRPDAKSAVIAPTHIGASGRRYNRTSVTGHGVPSSSSIRSVETRAIRATLKLPSASVPSGGGLMGDVIVDNTTGSVAEYGICGPLFKVELVGRRQVHVPSLSWVSCAPPLVVAEGRSLEKVVVRASVPCGHQHVLECQEGLYALPPGPYVAVIMHAAFHGGPLIRVGPSIPVVVTSASASNK